MVLSDDLNGKMILQNSDKRIISDCFHQSALNLGTGVVGMVQDAELGMTTLTMQIELTISFLVKINAPMNQLLDLLRRILHHLLYGLRITEPITGYHSVVNMLLKIIHLQIGNTGYATLCTLSISLV